MTDIQVHYRKGDKTASISVAVQDTFADVKTRVLRKFSDQSDVEEEVYSVCIVEIPCSFMKQRCRSNVTPHQNSRVAELLDSLYEANFVGQVYFTVVDMRGGEDSVFAPIGSEELLHACLAATSDKPDVAGDDNVCTSWATTGYNAIGAGFRGAEPTHNSAAANGGGDGTSVQLPSLFEPITILESLFAELSSSAVIQGRLQKKIHHHRRHDIWREEYCILDGCTGRLWHFPITAETASSANSRELGVSGLGVPSFIALLSGCKIRAQDAVTVTTHRSDPTSFTVTIADDWLLDPAAAYAGRLYSDQRSYTFRAPSAEKAGKWVSRLSSLHGMLHQPLLPPGPDNPRLYKPVMAHFIQHYTEGGCTYLAAVERAFADQHSRAATSHFHHSITTSLAACGGGGNANDDDSSPVAAPVMAIPVTARNASHWAGNCMFESIEDCIAVTQQTNSQRDLDTLEELMTFEGMLKNKYLRGYFQKFLSNNCTEETLLFWEYAEDYYRGHPHSPHPFTHLNRRASVSAGSASARHNSSVDVLTALQRQDAVMLATAAAVRQWAESLFLTFLHINAPYQVGCCTAADIARVSSTIDNLPTDEMPPYNLFRAIQLATFAFMKKAFYPDFVAQKNYHRLLVAAVHASDRVAMNAAIMSTCVAPDREAPGFDASVGAPEASAEESPSTSSGINYPAASRRGFFGMVKGMVSKRLDAGAGNSATAGAKETSTKVDAKNYAARWRVTKLVVFDMVRSGVTLTSTTSSATATSTAENAAGSRSSLYRISRRNGKRKSVIGDKVRKLLALQRGIVRKIGWLPEWWWDLVPPIEAEVEHEVRLSELVDHNDDGAGEDAERTRLLSESTLLDEAEDPMSKEKDHHRHTLIAAADDPWRWLTVWDDCEWMDGDMNALTSTMERVRQNNAQTNSAGSVEALATTDIHMELLIRRLSEGWTKRQAPQGRMGSLYLPGGWKPSESKNNAEAIKKAVLAEAKGVQEPALMKYSETIPRCIAQVNISSGRALLEDYHHLEPTGFHMEGAVAGLGTLILCGMARCRYIRPASKAAVPTLLRGFSKRGSNLTERTSDAAPSPYTTQSPSRPTRGGGGLVVAQTESVVISDCPSAVLTAGPQLYNRAALQYTRAPRWEEFHVPGGNASVCSDWPRQCVALYVCMGVPRLYLMDPVTYAPSACIDLHAVRLIAPSERFLQAIDLQDKTDCVWQISPEGLDAEDAREAPRRWLLTMSALSLPSTKVVHVLRAGYLQKRGRVNRAFRLRWFVLCSDLKLRYYKDDQSGVWKGTIDLSRSDAGDTGPAGGKGSIARFDKEVVVTMQSTQRMFTLLAEDVATAEDWLGAIMDLLNSPLGSTEGPSHGSGGSLLGDEGAGEEDDDDADED